MVLSATFSSARRNNAQASIFAAYAGLGGRSSFSGSSGITRGFFIGWFEGTGKKTKELLKWKPG
jgi:transposase